MEDTNAPEPVLSEKSINDDPVKLLPSFNPFDYILPLWGAFGWWIIGGFVLFILGYDKLKPVLDKWRTQREDAKYHKDPDMALKKLEAMELARAKLQERFAETAKEYEEKQKEKAEKKRQEYINKNSDNSGRKLGTSDYLPLCGPGSSGNYKPAKRKCPGGGCGR